MSFDKSVLLGKALAAVKWNAIGVAGRVLLQLVVMIVIARAIGPAEFGIFGVCMLAFSLGLLVADLGLGMAMVQSEQLPRELLRAAWGRILLSHGAIALLLGLGAPWLAQLFGAPEALPQLRAMALIVLISASQPPLLALRRRTLDFKSIQQANLLGYALGFGICGTALAHAGAGAWSLVAALLVQQLVLAVAWARGLAFPWWPRWGVRLGVLQQFGLRAVLSNMANWVTENAPNMVVARFHGTAGLGEFNIANNLARTPTNHLVTTLQQVIMSATSRAQNEQQMLGQAYLALVRAVSLLSLPMFIAAAAVSDSVIAALYGPKWAGAAALFVPLALAMPFHALMAIAGPILWGRGRTGAELKVQSGVALLLLLALTAVALLPLIVKAWTVCALYALRSLWVSAAVMSDLTLKPAALLRVLFAPLLLGLAVAACLALCDWGLRALAAGPALSLAALLLAGLMLMALAFRSCGAWLLGAELAGLAQRVPPRWRPCLGIPAR
jgi:O-antigen/teichoic acid export membrane protein